MKVERIWKECGFFVEIFQINQRIPAADPGSFPDHLKNSPVKIMRMIMKILSYI